MRFHRPSDEQLRLFALLASLILIVGIGWLVRHKVANDNIEALNLLAHTQEVRAALFDVTGSLSEMRADALAARDRPTSQVSADYSAAHTRYASALDNLRKLTIDSPIQQERIGMLRARAEQRVAVFERAMSGEVAPAGSNTVANVALHYPIDDISGAILGDATRLVERRQQVASQSIRYGRYLSAAAALAQIFLLGTLIVLAERQARRRFLAEVETRHAIERARLIVESVREPIAVIGEELRLVTANHAFAQFYGLTRPVTGTLDDVADWADKGLKQRLRDVLATQRELWDYETTQGSGDEVRNVVVNARPMKLPDVDEAAALLTVSDVTARRKGEERLRELNRQLTGKIAQVSEVNRELEAFSYSVSHDLRAPLRHVSGFSDKLRALVAAGGDEKAAHYCEVIGQASAQMSALIEDLLRYSRLGRHAMRLQAVDMQSLVDEVRSTLMSDVEERTVTWTVAPLPMVIADASLMRLAWQNLLDNAIKYTRERPEATVEIGLDDSGDTERVFWIRDNGTGFDMKYVDKLFGVFQRLHKPSDFPGTGIGLASVRRIIARHGGRTWAEGVQDEGATFFFSLPRHAYTD